MEYPKTFDLNKQEAWYFATIGSVMVTRLIMYYGQVGVGLSIFVCSVLFPVLVWKKTKLGALVCIILNLATIRIIMQIDVLFRSFLHS
jgi:hypothetical protein